MTAAVQAAENNIVQLRRATWERPDLSILRGGLPPAPTFPADLLGSFWADWCHEVAGGANAPFDYAAASLLTLAGALIGNSRVAFGHGSWREPPILWTVLIGNPSSGKSPAMDPFMDIVTDFEQRAGGGQRIYLDDASAVGATEVAAVNPKGLLLFRDELSGWWSSFARLGGEQFWLKAFGARPQTSTRADGDIHVPRLAISVLGGSQPDTIRAFVETKNNRGFASRWLYVFPETTDEFKLGEEVNHALAEDALWRLRNLPVAGRPTQCAIPSIARDDFQSWAGHKRKQAGENDSVWGEWLGKQAGISLRVALILDHLKWAAEAPLAEPAPAELSEHALSAAMHFIDTYSMPMAARTLDMVARRDEERVASRLALLLRGAGMRRFNARDLRRTGRVGERTDAKTLSAACEVLEAASLIKHIGQRADGRPGRVPSDYEVNPALFAAEAR